MKVLSLFDGISCGMVAFEKASIPVERYVAYEIEESAIKISKSNYPQIEHCGDVFKADFTQYEDFDILIGGSPCTFWSVAQKADKRETTSEGFGWELFQQYLRAWKESGCKYFLYENNYSMADAIKNEITKHLGVEPIMINSSLLSAQTRKRYYWTNIPNVSVPSDKGVMLADIIESGNVDRDKSLCIARRYAGFNGSQSYMCRRYFGKSFGQAIFEGDIEEIKAKWKADPYFESEDKNIRQMTLKECERLQTLPDDYTNVDGVSTQMKYEAIGNGWTVDVIAHILTYLKKGKEKEMELRIEKITFPEVIDFNFEELKQEITNRVAMYANMVYTEGQVKQAKTDRANLNKFVKALSDERIKVKKQCLKPYEEFEAKVNELSKIVQEPIKMIDKQVKEYEEQKKQEKLNEITYFFNSTDHPEWLHIAQIMNDKWLNASVSMKSIQEEIKSRCEQIENDVITLSNLPEFGFEATEVYKTTLDINKALNEGHGLSEIQKRKAEHEAEQARLKAEAEAKISEVAEVAHNLGTASYGEVMESAKALENQFKAPAKQWVSFSALLTTEDAMALKAFFDSRQIEFKAV